MTLHMVPATYMYEEEYLKVTIFLWVLTFDISADWHKNAKFCTRNH